MYVCMYVCSKNKTNFIRNVRLRLQRLFPYQYKGKEGMQRLIRDVRFLKISCDGKIPPVTENDRANQKAKRKVSDEMEFTPESGNFLKPDIGPGSNVSSSLPLADQNTHSLSQEHAHNVSFGGSALPLVNTTPSYNIPNMHQQQLPLLNMFTSPTQTQNPFFPFGTNNLLQANIPIYP